MRNALFATAAMNLLAALGFLPAGGALRGLAGLPAGGHPLYLSIVAIFVVLFGLGYLWCAVAGRADPLFIALAAAGKISFVALLVWYWASGELPLRAPLVASPDLLFGGIFLKWLLGSAAAATSPQLSSSRASL
jgi:hypothetical protein